MERCLEISLSLIDQCAVSRPAPGQNVCGDIHLVKPIRDGVLLAAVDGLGHGIEAIAAARAARASLKNHAEEPLAELVRHCHEELVRTRGVVMTVATLSASCGRLAWLGVGNVEAVLFPGGAHGKAPCERALLRSGIVGYQLPALHPGAVPVAPGDLLIFATDGIGAGFTENLRRGDSAKQLADGILHRHFKGTDDALVLAVRYIGSGHE